MPKLDPVILIVAALAVLVSLFVTINMAVRRFAELRRREQLDAAIPDDSMSGGFFISEVQVRGIWQRIGNALKPESDSKDFEELVDLHVKAGLRSGDEINAFFAMRAKVLLGGLGIAVFILLVLGDIALLFFPVIFGVAFLGPKFFLRSRANARQQAIEDAVPPAMDLLEACIEAGLGLEQALARVAAELVESEPEIADELALVVAELRAGMSLSGAFRKLSDRVGVEELRTLCSVIIQASTLGAPLSKTLKDFSQNARKRRSLTLEEKAGKITAGLTLPLTICLLPSAILVVLGPAVVSVLEAFK